MLFVFIIEVYVVCFERKLFRCFIKAPNKTTRKTLTSISVLFATPTNVNVLTWS